MGLELGQHLGHRHEGTLTSPDLDGDGAAEELAFTSDVRDRVTQMSGTLRFSSRPADSAGLERWALVGAGFYHVWHNAGVLRAAGRGSAGGGVYSGIPENLHSTLDPGLSVGAGLAYRTGFDLAAGGDFRWHMVFEQSLDRSFAVGGFVLGYFFSERGD